MGLEEVKLISIDPGVHNMAVAEWGYDRKLLRAYNIRSTPAKSLGANITHWARVGRDIDSHKRFYFAALVGEIPVAYPGKQGMKVDANDLLHLAACAGAFYAGLSESKAAVELVLPAEWKAQVPKDICRGRILEELSEDEKGGVEKGGDMHNVYDAVGIGLFKLGRLGRGLVKIK